jgi:hypothetical protein
MHAPSNASMRAIPYPQTDVSPAEVIALFCGRASGASLCLIVHDLDLNAGIF